MPVRVVGRVSKFNGKTLLEIACNLKNFGVGRIVCRSAFDRYQEPTYYKIVSVEPEMDSDHKKGNVVVEQVFRGKHIGVRPLKSIYKPDFRLIAKEDEDALCNRPFEQLPERIMPATQPFPPLLSKMIVDEMRAKGQPCDKEPELKICYQNTEYTQYRPAAEGETPNAKFTKHISWNLYEEVMPTPS